MKTATEKGHMIGLRRAASVLICVLTLAACDEPIPAEVRSDAIDFELLANWSATVTPTAPATVQGSVALQQYLGYHFDVTVNLTGATPNGTYQWRIFRGGNCSVNVAATTNTAGNGLVRFANVESYPDIVASATGTATITRTIAGTLDALGAYSVRFRPSQTATGWNGVNPTACGTLQVSGGG